MSSEWMNRCTEGRPRIPGLSPDDRPPAPRCPCAGEPTMQGNEPAGRELGAADSSTPLGSRRFACAAGSRICARSNASVPHGLGRRRSVLWRGGPTSGRYGTPGRPWSQVRPSPRWRRECHRQRDGPACTAQTATKSCRDARLPEVHCRARDRWCPLRPASTWCRFTSGSHHASGNFFFVLRLEAR